MAKRKTVRRKASAEYAQLAKEALLDEKKHAKETQAQVNEVFAQLRSARSVVDKLRQERERLGLSLADMQSMTGMARSMISKLENHHTKNPTLQTIVRYAQAIGMTVDIQVKRQRG